MAIIIPGAGTLSLTGTSVSTQFTFKASPSEVILTLSGVTAVRAVGFKVLPAAGTFSLTGTTPLLFGLVRSPSAGSMSFTGLAPNQDQRLTQITGSIYSGATGTKMTTGTLFIRPKSFIQLGNDVVAPSTISYTIPGTGDMNLALAPSNGVTYL